MTTITKQNFPINNTLTADITFHIAPDLSVGFWNEEIIIEDFDIHQLYDDGKPINTTPCLTSLFLSAIYREFYSSHAKMDILDECMEAFYQDHEIKREMA